MTTTTKPTTAAKVMREMEERQKREGCSFGYIGHEARTEPTGRKMDRIVLSVLADRGYDLEDAYQALNSRDGRHTADWLMGVDTEEELRARLAKSLWPTPAAMWVDLAPCRKKEGPGAPLAFAEYTPTARPNPNTRRILKAGRILGEWAVMAYSADDREFKDGTCWLRGFSCLGEAKLMVERLQNAMDEGVR